MRWGSGWRRRGVAAIGVALLVGCGRVGYGVQTCDEAAPAAAIAAYSFDAVPIDATDSVGGHDGTIEGTPGGVTSVASPLGCGSAVAFDEEGRGAEAWISIPDSSDWDLSRGSIDLWVRAPPEGAGVFAAILSRDADGAALPGHVALFIEPDGTVWARLQRSEAQMAYRCAESPIPPGEWGRVTLNFGPPDFELRLDGATQRRGAPLVSASGADVRCDEQRANWGIDGNDNPWILGGGSQRAPEGSGTPVTDFFRGGAIDELTISSARR